MKSDDMMIRSLSGVFVSLGNRRRELDLTAADDVTRADASARWMACAREILALQASTIGALRIKARVVLALVEATGATGPAIEAAKSLAQDVDRRRGEFGLAARGQP